MKPLGEFLREHRPLWHPRAFYGLPLPWESELPELARWLDAQPSRHGPFGDALEWALSGPPPLRDWARAAKALAHVDPLPHWSKRASAHTQDVGSERASVETQDSGSGRLTPQATAAGTDGVALSRRVLDGITGKKQAQLLAFASVLPPLGQRPLLDWCGGKAHLGRLLATLRGARELLVVEHDPALCRAGERLVSAKGAFGAPGKPALKAMFHTVDALGAEARALAEAGCDAVALHACGDLHGALIEHYRGKLVAIAPCCFLRALGPDGLATVLSAAGRDAGLRLDANDLRLVHESPSDAGRRDAAAVDRVQQFRLGFDEWLRAETGSDAYTHMPACPPQWFALPFEDFCSRFADLGGHPKPRGALGEFEAAGVARFEAVRRRDPVRAVFRRALEVWLVEDRAQRLRERGFDVTMGTFCPEGVTPRNLMILGRA